MSTIDDPNDNSINPNDGHTDEFINYHDEDKKAAINEKINDIVLGCMLANRTINETIVVIRKRTGIAYSYDWVKKKRQAVNAESIDELKAMKFDNQTYILEYLRHIEQVKRLIREAWNIIHQADSPKDWNTKQGTANWNTKQKAMDQIHAYTVTLHKFMDFLPAISSMRIWDEQMNPEHNLEPRQLIKKDKIEEEDSKEEDSESEVNETDLLELVEEDDNGTGHTS